MTARTITNIDADLLNQVAVLIAAAVGRDEAIGLVGPLTPAEYLAYLDGLVRDAAQGDAGLVAVVEDGVAIGTAQWRRSAYRTRTVFAEVDRVVVAPEHRGKGVAKALVEAIAADAAKHRIELLGLEVRGNNHAAIALYQKHGFRRTGKWENAVAIGEDRFDVVLMARELSRPRGVRLHGETA
jgi:ribosomal protein S18 acetylase RimI-like enzyme